MATSTFYHGKDGGFTIGTTTTVGIKAWKLTHKVADHDTTSTTGGGYGEVQGGIETVEGSLEANYDTTNGPYALTLIPGTYITNLKLKTNTSTATTHWIITSAFILSVEPDFNVEDVVKYTVNFRNHGTFTKPTA